MKNRTIQWRHCFILNGFKFWMNGLCIVSKPPIFIIFCVRRFLHCETWKNSFISRILKLIFNLSIVYQRNYLFKISKFWYSENTCIRRLGANWRKLNSRLQVISYFVVAEIFKNNLIREKKQEAEVLALCIPMSSDVYQSPGCNNMLYLEHA